MNTSAFVVTRPTGATLLRGDGVRWGVSVAVDALRLSHVASDDRIASPHVDARRDGLKVVGVHAVTHTAEVVELQALGNGADQKFVDVSMSTDHAFAIEDDAVARVVHGTYPQPTSVGLLDLLPEPIDTRRWVVRIAPMEPAHVVGSAPAAPVMSLATPSNRACFHTAIIPQDIQKGRIGKPTPEQARWIAALAAAGVDVGVWTWPHSREDYLRELGAEL